MDQFDPAALHELVAIQDSQPIRACSFYGDFFALGTNSRSLKICSMENIVKRLTHNTTGDLDIELVYEQ
jgi:hypothetical protein